MVEKKEKTNDRKGKNNRRGWSKIDDYDVEMKKNDKYRRRMGRN